MAAKRAISLSDPADCSYQIIMATEIIGLSRKEREIIAYIVKFNTTEFPYYEELSRETDLDRSEYLTVAKLAAILRVANACDRSHKQKFENVKVSLKDKELIIQVDTPEDITLERGLFTEKAAFFEEVFKAFGPRSIRRNGYKGKSNGKRTEHVYGSELLHEPGTELDQI